MSVPPQLVGEIAAAWFQILVSLGLTAIAGALWARYRKPYFAVWTAAWACYAVRVASIVGVLLVGGRGWLYWNQVAAGWTVLLLLWGALAFTQRLRWDPLLAAFALFPPVWSYVGIYRIHDFYDAVVPAVVFLSLASAWSAWAFFRYHREVGSKASLLLSLVFGVWALHHLDYPFLRAWGGWTPWGYYLDMGFQLAAGVGILGLALEDLDQGLRTLTALSGELQEGRGREGVAEAVLRRALGLRGVQGSALHLSGEGSGTFVDGAGVAALWPYEGPPDAALEAVALVRSSRRPEVVTGARGDGGGRSVHPYIAALPVLRAGTVAGALVVVGESRDPFTVLDRSFLLAFGSQVGAALENEVLYARLEERTHELERLQARMVRQHEEERNRLSRELHDETAQVLAAVNLQLGLLQERVAPELSGSLERARDLVGQGIKSIRSVTRNLRPTALDDLGMLPAMRALVRDLSTGARVRFDVALPAAAPGLGADVELALYRTLQEALANVLRHADASEVAVELVVEPERAATLTVRDDGRGFPTDDAGVLDRTRGGLAGIRERIHGVGGRIDLENSSSGGARVRVVVPVTVTSGPGT